MKIARNITEPDYRAIDAINVSALVHMERSPAHFIHHYNTPARSAAMDFGTLAHMAILEPRRFGAEVVRGGPINPKTQEPYGRATQAWAAFEADHPGKRFLTDDEYEAIAAIQQAVWDHPIARKLMLADGPAEAVMQWTDKATGVACKGRVDRLVQDAKGRVVIAADLKTTADASEQGITRIATRLHYAAKVAWYRWGIKETTGEDMPLPLVFVETEAPYGVNVWAMDDDWIDFGRQQFRRWLDMYAKCASENRWPGYEARDLVIPAPKWMRSTAEVSATGASDDHPF
jgi:hypothetical protein